MKRNITLATTLLAILLTACTNRQADYRLAVPDDAVAVAQLRLMSLAEEAGLQSAPLLESLAPWLSLLGTEASRQAQAIVEDPSLLGIDFDDPAYVFATPNQTLGIVLHVEDEALLDAVIEQLAREQICGTVSQQDGYKSTTIAGTATLTYDETLLLITLSLNPNASSAALARYATERMRCDASTAYFASDTPLDGASQALAIVVSGNLLPQFRDLPITQPLLALLQSSLNQAEASLDDMECLITMGQTADGLQARLQLRTDNAALRQALDERIGQLPTIGNALLPYANEDDDLTCLFACDGAALLNSMEADRDLRMAIRMMEGLADVEAILRAVDGDVLFSIGSFDMTEVDHLRFTLLAELDNTDFAAEIPDWQARAVSYGLTFEETAAGQYRINAFGLDVYMGVNGQVFSLATKPTALVGQAQTGWDEAMGKRLHLRASTPQGRITLSSQDLLDYTITLHDSSLATLLGQLFQP